MCTLSQAYVRAFFLLFVINREMQIVLEEGGLLVLNTDTNITGLWL